MGGEVGATVVLTGFAEVFGVEKNRRTDKLIFEQLSEDDRCGKGVIFSGWSRVGMWTSVAGIFLQMRIPKRAVLFCGASAPVRMRRFIGKFTSIREE